MIGEDGARPVASGVSATTTTQNTEMLEVQTPQPLIEPSKG